jgi:hypothetical protein
MFGLFRRARRQRSAAPSSRLVLEGLEFRGAPASLATTDLLANPDGSMDQGTTMVVVDPSQDQSATTTVSLDLPPADNGGQIQPPTVTNFQYQVQYDGSYTFSGHVDAFSDEGLIVHLDGTLVSLQSVTVCCDQNGNFEFNVHLNGSPSDDGTVTAVAVDLLGQESNTASVAVRQSLANG